MPSRNAGAPARKSGREALERIRNYYALNTVLRQHPELAYWIVHWDGKSELRWMELNESGRLRPFHFEIHFGKDARRDAYYLRELARARREKKLVVGNLHGFSDLFYFVCSEGGGHTFLYAGQFLSEPPDWNAIGKCWRELTGQAPASANPDFERFVRMTLDLPVLEPAILAAIEAFLAMYAEFLGRPRSPGLHERVERLMSGSFVRRWPNNDWVLQAVSPEKFHLTPWALEGKLADWMKEEMGICRLPTTALALMPLYPRDERNDPLDTLVKNRRIQLDCIKLAMQMPETGAAPLHDYAVSFLTSTPRGKSAARVRLELRERAEKLQAFVRQQHGLRAAVGIGRSVPPGAQLYASHREAVLALHLCVQLDRDTLFYDESYSTSEGLGYAELHRAATRLLEAYTKVSESEFRLSSDQYVRAVLLYSDERMEVVRSQFQTMLFQIMEVVRRRHPLPPQHAERLVFELARRLEEADSVSHLIDGFKAALGRLLFFSSAALEGPKVMRLEATLAYLRENFSEPLRLPQVARRAGFSVPAFSRVFRHATGTSFLSYVRGLRVEHAKILLRDTALSMEQIAQACGFQSQHHLIRSFKKVAGGTPGSFRRAAGGSEPS